MRNLALALYRSCVRRLTGFGLDKVRPLHAIHNLLLRHLRPEHVTVFGHRLYLDAGDSLNLSIHGVHEPEETDLVQSLVRKGDTVLDIGAHIGYFTILLAQLTGESGTVVAFETHPANAALLRRSMDESGYKHVVIENKAVTAHSAKLELFASSKGSVDHRIVGSLKGRDRIQVDGVALDDYFDPNTRIDFIKMDIQGAEGHAILGMKNLIAHQDRLTILSEFEPWGLEASGVGARTYLDMLTDLGFVLYDLQSESGRKRTATPETLVDRYPPLKDRFTNLLCVKGPPRPEEL